MSTILSEAPRNRKEQARWPQSKPSLSELLPDLQPGKTERHGSCFRCGGEDRFIVFLDSGRGWCRQCGWKGDSIALVMDRDHLSFREAQRQLGLDTRTSPSFRRKARVHSLALNAARQAYTAWQRSLFRTLIDQYWELHTECDIAEVAYRAIHRVPALYTLQERHYWTFRLATLYDRIAVLENDLARILPDYTLGDALDLMTDSNREAERLALWRTSEVSRG
jgi:hypothetical protein